jgi:MoaA/NifB/PqqE/SkfB family radical SAM enzyme
MCDIWKDNKNLKQLTEADISGLLSSLKKFGTKQVVMSGGEALLNANFFRFCEILKKEKIHITLLSTGITLKKNVEQIVQWVDDVIVSLDGNEPTHDTIRNIPGAYSKLKEGIEAIRSLKPNYKITARTVIHKLNFRVWANIIEAAKDMRLNQISFLPADVSSQAFNRETPWDAARQYEVVLEQQELHVLRNIINDLIAAYKLEFETRFIAESPEKLMKIFQYYCAIYGIGEFPFKKCNAPWVSTVIEADGTVRPCFFHQAIGNIRDNSLSEILNGDAALQFRKNLDMDKDITCKRCVCYLNLPPRLNPARL